MSTKRNATTWRPGQSGNPKGRPPGVDLEDYFRELLARVDRGEPTEADKRILAGCRVPTLRVMLRVAGSC